MEKEFIPYELALRMKTLGFNENCFRVGNPNGVIFWRFMDVAGMEGVGIDNLLEVEFDDRWVEIPTYSQAFRWFKEKKYHSGIIPYYDYYYFMIKDFNKGPEYNSRHFESDDLRELSSEEAELACLKKLIEIVESKKS